MSSRREEERNEKIIRGLMKLPPNRRCINCNSLGPQYVCTNFWTFVCTTCSGIHREFTHRVKSVSMSKFTSQEVEALQKGGNQRARDIYLKDWDLQRQRLPDSSNVDRVREFIKNVYVDKRYAGGKTTDKPPRDLQSLRNHEDETRRASSYHSYSQSPPYDYQYEERRYGKQGAVLTRKPGSDRGHYEAKISSFVYSPGRSSEQTCEDRFSNEGTGSRLSDYSASSRGHPFESGTQSPNFQKDTGFDSPSILLSRDNLTEAVQRKIINTISETKVKGVADGIHPPQRTTSSGSFGSFDSNSTSLKSFNSSSLIDVVSEPEQSRGIQQDKMSTFPSLTQSSYSQNSVSVNLSEASIVPQPVTSAASTNDLFQLPAASSAVDLFQLSSVSSHSSVNLSGPSKTSPNTSLDSFFETYQKQPIANFDKSSPQLSAPKDEGWATFDLPQPIASNPINQYLTARELSSSDGDALGKPNSMSSSITSVQWPSFQNSNIQGTSSSMSTPWNEDLQNIQASLNATSPQSWNAFEDSVGTLPLENTQQSSRQEVTALPPSSFVNQYLNMGISEDFTREGTQTAFSDGGFSGIPSYVVTGPSYAPSSVPDMGMQSHATKFKSTNPFDVPLDLDSEPSNMFLDMSSLQAALPNAPLSSSFVGGVTESWFPQNPVAPYIPATAQDTLGGLAYIAGQAPTSQLPNVTTQGSVASIGGNPFA